MFFQLLLALGLVTQKGRKFTKVKLSKKIAKQMS